MYQEENNLLKTRNEDLNSKLHRTEAYLSRVKEELGHFRAANGRSPVIHFDKELQLHEKLKVSTFISAPTRILCISSAYVSIGAKNFICCRKLKKRECI